MQVPQFKSALRSVFVLYVLVAAWLMLPNQALAQEAETENQTATEEVLEQIVTTPLQAEAGDDRVGVIGRNILFDASGSQGPSDKTITYVWDFGDGQQFEGIDASHIYTDAGTYKASLTISDGENESVDTIIVTIARDVVLLIADDSAPRENIRALRQYAQRRSTYLVVVRPQTSSDPAYEQSRNIAEQLVTSEDLGAAKLIISWTERNIGLEALSEIGRIYQSGDSSITNSRVSFSQKPVVRVDDKLSSGASARLAQNTYNILLPPYILLSTTSALETIISNLDASVLVDALQDAGYDYQIIGSHSERVLGELTPLNVVSYGINYLINAGVSPDTIFLLLILPVVATIIAFARQVIGIKAFGIYVPSIITLTFVVMQLRYGLVLFLILLVVATLSRLVAKRLRILYMPRMAIVLTLVSFSIFITFILADIVGYSGVLSISIFPILVLIILTEKFVEAQIEQGHKAAIVITAETLVLAILSYMFVTWNPFETFIMAYPEIIVFTLLINIFIGKFMGLRITEYIRFWPLLKSK